MLFACQNLLLSLAPFYRTRLRRLENDPKSEDAVLPAVFYRKDGTGYKRQIAPSSQSVWYIRGCDLRPRDSSASEIRRRSLATPSSNPEMAVLHRRRRR